MLIILAISASYFIFAVLLNSVGTVILQSINSFEVTKIQASTLEGYKDLSIAIVSFLIASFVPKIGYKMAIIIGLIIVGLLCLFTPWIASFWFIKVLFAGVGTAFALVKISVYAIIGQLSRTVKEHTSLMNIVEGIFMLGVLSGYWIFSVYINEDVSSLTWLNVYYLLAVLVMATIVAVIIAPVSTHADASEPLPETVDGFAAMLKLAWQPIVLVFVISIFLYVLIEQGIGTWLPTFNREVIGLPVSLSVQITSLFAVALAVGRLLAGAVLRYVHWYPFLNTCVILMASFMLLTLPLAQPLDSSDSTTLSQLPVSAMLLPFIGLFMAPIYPVINSAMLSALPKNKHASMTGLIVVFSALGGTTGSIITGAVFEHFGGQNAFYLLVLPIVTILFTLALFRKSILNLTEGTLNAA
ncbi:MFS transporter [Alteromonas sp. MYP5]|uniref:MFS transporter n=1 Tax=Alteromonas ponticola TaxID=2720613 RepID=A0ABX1R373_9ALTE|nr:MFS transporter [Alteromonas ponticola]NMH60887.1 MFS transporter [Alteromonas ponticola]